MSTVATLGSSASAGRFPGSARPRSAAPAGSEGPNTGWGARQRAHQLSDDAPSLLSLLGCAIVLGTFFYLGFCW